MSRVIHPDTLAEIQARSANFCSLVYMGFPTPVRMTTAAFDIPVGSDVFAATGNILKISTVKESTETRVGTLSLTLSTVDQTMLALFLDQAYTNVPLIYWKAWFKFEGNQVVVAGNPVEYFSGNITSPKGNESGKRSTMVVRAASHYAQWDYKNSVHTNMASQQIHYPDDKCFEFSGTSIRGVVWGRGDGTPGGWSPGAAGGGGGTGGGGGISHVR